ncbi:hypothetical protein [Desulfitobacterium sp. AusDCA]|uniref:hypothetical protein n=1 Tax=Desulfitobacterium sp. AusDCA TaxID=3240383 RepID=UPI003DA72379
MTNTQKMTYTMIEIAVNKGLRDIEENVSRGVRNLVDLGTHLTRGRFQKDYFRVAQQILLNENSPYYAIANNLVHNVDHRIIKTLGLNLGFSSWALGAEKIRKCEKDSGYHIPWTLLFDFRLNTPTALTTKVISSILDNGEEIGIYSGMFFINHKTSLEELISLLASHKESIYFLFVSPEMITTSVTEAIAQAGNVTLAMEMNTNGDNPKCRSSAKKLLRQKCLYGAYSRYNDDNVLAVMSKQYACKIEKLKCTFVFLVREKLENPKNKEHFTQFIQSAKSANTNPFFFIDFYEDLTYVDQTISTVGDFLVIKSDGSVAVSNKKKVFDGLNIKADSLQKILKKVMPIA